MAKDGNVTDTAAEEGRNNADFAAGQARAGADEMRDAGKRMQDQTARAGEAMKASGQKMAEGGSALGLKVLNQAETNTQEAFTAMRAAAQAKDISEVMKIQGDFLREQGSRSVAQMREISELIMQFGRDAVAPLRGGTGDEPPR